MSHITSSSGYISSTAPQKYKTLLLSIFNVVRNVAMNVTVLVGSIIPWTTLSLMFGAVPPLILVIMSPLLRMGNQQSYQRLEGKTTFKST